MSDEYRKSVCQLYDILRNGNFRIAANFEFAPSPGHMVGELDNLLRMAHLNEVPPECPILCPVPRAELTQTLADLYGEAMAPRVMYMPDDLTFVRAREIARAYPKMVVDPGHSHFRYAMAEETETRLAPFMEMVSYVVNNKYVMENHRDWYRRMSASKDYQPFQQMPEMDSELVELLGGRTDDLALIHFRSYLGNASPISPVEQYEPSLQYLCDHGLRPVLVGRDPCPEAFKKYGIIPYAESELANFRHDLMLFKAARIAMISGSGIAAIAQAMGTPLVYLNYWHLIIPYFGPSVVWVPSLIQETTTGRTLTFTEQVDFFLNRPQIWEMPGGIPWSFVLVGDHELRTPDAEEVLQATIECFETIGNPRPYSDLQQRFRTLGPDSNYLTHLDGRLSQHFAEKYRHLLP